MRSPKHQSRITQLETEIARLKVRLTRAEGKKPLIKDWLDSLQTCFTPEDAAAHKKAAWYGRQWRESHIDLEPSPELKCLRKDYNTILNKLKILGRFKTKQAAIEYAHREFTR